MNWNHYKSMLATIYAMFVNEKIIRIYTFKGVYFDAY